MNTKRPAQLSKPTLNTEAARKFATAAPAPSKAASREEPLHVSTATEENASAAGKVGSGQIPEGDVRLTANIRKDLHLKLKIEAAIRGTTIGEIIEGLIESHLTSR